jgi:exosome complex RNA-binding protein Rrp4
MLSARAEQTLAEVIARAGLLWGVVVGINGHVWLHYRQQTSKRI